MRDLTAEIDELKRQMATDNENRRQLEEAFRQSQEQLSRAKDVIHDVSNLLLVMYFSGKELLSSLAEGDPKRPAALAIDDARKQIAELTRQFRYGQSDTTSTASASITDFNHLLPQVENLIRRIIKSDTILKVKLAVAPAKVVVPVVQAERILVHLLLSALAAIPEGGWITLDVGHLDLALDREAGPGAPSRWVRLCIADTGVTESQQPHGNVADASSPTSKVTQLRPGMPMVEGLVRQFGGTIDIRFQPESGTKIEIRFPALDQPARSNAPASRPRIASRGQTILVVEDEPLLRKFVKSSLESRGFRVIDTANGTSAIAAAVDQSPQVDLLISDVKLPDMTGYEVVEKLQTLHPELRVVLMSGMMSEEPTTRKISRDLVSFLPKPFQTSDLLMMVQESLDNPVRAS